MCNRCNGTYMKIIFCKCSPGFPVFIPQLLHNWKVKFIPKQQHLFPYNGLLEGHAFRLSQFSLLRWSYRYWWTDLLAGPWRNQYPLQLSLFHRGLLQPFVCAVIREWLVLYAFVFSKKRRGYVSDPYLHAECKLMGDVVLQASFWAVENDIMILLDLLTKQETLGKNAMKGKKWYTSVEFPFWLSPAFQKIKNIILGVSFIHWACEVFHFKVKHWRTYYLYSILHFI